MSRDGRTSSRPAPTPRARSEAAAGPRAGFHFRPWGSEPSDAVEGGRRVKKDFEVTGTNRRRSKEIKVARAGGGGADVPGRRGAGKRVFTALQG